MDQMTKDAMLAQALANGIPIPPRAGDVSPDGLTDDERTQMNSMLVRALMGEAVEAPPAPPAIEGDTGPRLTMDDLRNAMSMEAMAATDPTNGMQALPPTAIDLEAPGTALDPYDNVGPYRSPANPQAGLEMALQQRTVPEGDFEDEMQGAAYPVTGPTDPAPVQEAPTYEVRSGDSLWAIAKRLTGDGNNWRKIYEMNRDVLGDNPDMIQVGQTLRLA